MKLSEVCVKHPITTSMLFLGLTLMGFVSLSRIGMELFPDITVPSIAVATVLPGAGSYEIESSVTKPVEEAVSTVNNVEKVSSTSSEGFSLVIINFSYGTNIDNLVPDVREKLNSILDKLPADAERPQLIKFNPSFLPSLRLNVYSNTEGLDILRLVEKEIVPNLERIEGVGRVTVDGGRKSAVVCSLNLDSIGKLGIPIAQILQVFQGENISLPAGSMELKDRYLILRTIGEFKSIEDVEHVLVGYKDKVPIFLKDVATVKMDYLSEDVIVRTGGAKGVQISVQKQPKMNTVTVNAKILAKLEELKKKLPPSVQVKIESDQAVTVRDSIGSVADSAWQGGLLAVAVLLLFLRNIRSTLIISVVIPICVISTFALIDFAGMTLNIVSLMGITLAIGMFVDNSIVVLESVYRKQLAGLSPEEAAIQGASEVGVAISASTLTTVAVFIPLLFVKGLAGLLFRDLSLTISFSLMISLLGALTFTPVLCAKFMRLNRATMEKISQRILEENRHHEISLADVEVKVGFKPLDFISAKIQQGLQKLDEVYEKIIDWALRHAWQVIVIAVVLLGMSVGSIVLVGMEFLPEADEGTFSVSYETKIGSPYSYTEAKTKQIEQIILEECKGEIDTLSTAIGMGGLTTGIGNTGSNLGVINVKLIPRGERKRNVWKIVNVLDRKLKKQVLDTDIKLKIEGMSSLAAVASGESSPIVIELLGNDLDALYAYAKRIAPEVEKAKGLRDVAISFKQGKPEMQFVVKRKEAVSLGLNPFEIGVTLRTAYKGTTVSKYSKEGEDYDIVLMLRDEDRKSLDKVRSMFFVNRAGTKIPLENVVEIKEARGPLTIERKGRTRLIKITASLTNEVALNRVMDQIYKNIKAAGPTPVGITVEYGGSSQQMNESFSSLFGALMFAVALVYMVMASQFESFLHPFIIMFSIPFAIVGLVGALLISNTTFNLLAFVGMILLVGIVVNNGIVLIDYMNILQKRGVPLREAIVKGGRTRLKPVLMTTLTTLFALIPMAFGLGSGAELQTPMGRAVLGGLFTSTLITLILIPTIYWVVESFKQRRKKKHEILQEKVSV